MFISTFCQVSTSENQWVLKAVNHGRWVNLSMERVLFSSIAFAAVRFQGPGIWIDWKIFDNGICFLEASWIGKIKGWFLQWITEWRSHFVNFVLFSAAMADLDDLSHVSFTRLDCWVGGFKDVFWCTPKMNGLRLGVKVKLWIDLFFVVRKTICFPLSRDPLFDVSSFVIVISVAWDEDFKPLWKPRSFRPFDDWTWGGSLRFSWSAWCFMESFPEIPNA